MNCSNIDCNNNCDVDECVLNKDIKKILEDCSNGYDTLSLTGYKGVLDDIEKLEKDCKVIIETKDNRILELENTVDSLKCCETCEHGSYHLKGFVLNNCNLCKRNIDIDNSEFDIDNWIAKGIK